VCCNAAVELPTLQGPRLTLRPLEEDDVAPLAELGAAASVAEWWPGLDEPSVRDMLPCGEEPPTFAIVVDGSPVGLIQFWEEDDPEFRHAGMDLFLGEPWHGRGLGPEALWLLGGWLLRERGHHRLEIDPAAANERAIAAYRKVGFRPVGVMRRYERHGDGWRDGLLMDLLAEELEKP
jgi:aminoglycoside 6'-N-acetyltransferase